MSGPARVLRLIGVETLKVLGGKSLRTGLVAVVALTAFAAWNHETAAEETAWTVTATALSTGLWAAEIFLLVAGATAIAGETAQGTLKMILPHAYRRSDWIVAKAMVLLAQAVVLLAVATITALLFAKAGPGLTDVTQKDELTLDGTPKLLVVRTAVEMSGFARDTIYVSLASLVATAWVGLLISCVFDGVVAALSTGFLLFLGVKSAGTLFGASPDLLRRVYATYPGEMSHLVEKLGRGFAERWPVDLASSGVWLAVGTGVAAVALGAWRFARRDLQS